MISYGPQQVFNGRMHLLNDTTGSYYPVPLSMDEARLKKVSHPINVYQIVYTNGISHFLEDFSPLKALEKDLKYMKYTISSITKVSSVKESNVIVFKMHPTKMTKLNENFYFYK